FAGKKSAQIREILISESAWEEMTCLFAPSLSNQYGLSGSIFDQDRFFTATHSLDIFLKISFAIL
ncbi:hypothetical protein L1Q52_21600, partial [Klebsiella pneumoniae]